MSKILTEYDSMRGTISLINIFYLIQYFKCQNILEIGFYEGQTFGMMLEATNEGSQLTAIDINFQKEIYNKYYADSKYTKNKKIQLLNMSSEDFTSSEKYDLINVDGSHVLRYNDLCIAANCLDKNGILMLDDYKKHDEVVTEFLKLDHKLVPFLMDQQALFFHHPSHSAELFLDEILDNVLFNCCTLNNIDYKGYNVKEICPIKICIDHMHNVFSLFCHEINI